MKDALSSPSDTPDFMTVDAFDVELGEGRDAAIVVKDHSGPLAPTGRTSAEHAGAIAREIAWLQSAATVPGIVRLAELPMVEEAPCVRTVFAGGRTLRSDCPGEAETALVLIGVCETLTQLANHQLVHGSLTPEHIIIGTDLSATLCSPNTSGSPNDDLRSLGQCIEFATEQWPSRSDRLEEWLVLAKRLRDNDPSLSPGRVARRLADLAGPPQSPARPRGRKLAVAGMAILAGAAAVGTLLVGSPEQAQPGPEVEVAGMVVRVGEVGQIPLARPADACGAAQLFLLDPETFRVWKFDHFSSDHAGTALALVPGATELRLESDGTCATVTARGPAGTVQLDTDPGRDR